MVKKRHSRNSGAGKVRAAWTDMLRRLAGAFWTVNIQRDMQALYHSGTGRTGSVTLHHRGDGVWRYTVDAAVQRRHHWEHVQVKHPAGFAGPKVAHEITFMDSEAENVSRWLALWLLEYDNGRPMPDMPDGTPYDGGYQWTKARQAVTRG